MALMLDSSINYSTSIMFSRMGLMYSANCGLTDSQTHELTPEIFCSWKACSWPTQCTYNGYQTKWTAAPSFPVSI